MITLIYYRFIATPLTTVDESGKVCNLFDTVEHERVEVDECELQETVKTATRWLKDHYGFFKVYNNETVVSKHCNHKKMHRDLEPMGVEFKIKGHKE